MGSGILTLAQFKVMLEGGGGEGGEYVWGLNLIQSTCRLVGASNSSSYSNNTIMATIFWVLITWRSGTKSFIFIISFNSHINPWGRFCYDPCFPEDKGDAQVLGFAPRPISKSYFESNIYSICNAFWLWQIDLIAKDVFLQWHKVHSFTYLNYLKKIVHQITWSI